MCLLHDAGIVICFVRSRFLAKFYLYYQDLLHFCCYIFLSLLLLPPSFSLFLSLSLAQQAELEARVDDVITVSR